MKKVIMTIALVATAGSSAFAESASISVQSANALTRRGPTDPAAKIDISQAKAAIANQVSATDKELSALFTGKVNSVVVGGQIVVGALDLATTGVVAPYLVRLIYNVGQDLSENKPMQIQADLQKLNMRQELLEKALESKSQQPPEALVAETKEIEAVAAEISQKEAELKASLKSLNVNLGKGIRIVSKTTNGILYLYAVASVGSRVYIISHINSDPGLTPVVVIGKSLVSGVSVPNPVEPTASYVSSVIDYLKKLKESVK